MRGAYKNVRGCVFHNPLLLASVDTKLQKIAGSYLPFSTGIEIEATALNVKSFFHERVSHHNSIEKSIMMNAPKALRFNIQDEEEFDFRIPAGFDGLIALKNICDQLPMHFALNPGSGLHYHIDFTEHWDLIQYDDKAFAHWHIATGLFLSELDQWGYSGRFNGRRVDSDKCYWVRMCKPYRTIEFRIGEMTFDYEVMMKRITHCQSMVKRYIKKLEQAKVELQNAIAWA